MKIAIIPGQYLASPHAFVLDQIIGIIENGCNVDIIAQAPIKKEFLTKEAAAYSLLSKTHFIIPPSNKLKRIKSATQLIASNFLYRENRIFKSLNFFKNGRSSLSLRNVFIVDHFINNRYDLIHCHFGQVANNYIFLKEIFPEIIFVATFHGYDLSVLPRIFGRNVFDKLFSEADLITAGSDYAREKLIALGADEKKVISFPLGVRLNRYINRERNWVFGENLKIVTIGRLVEKKGIEYGIKAVAQVAENYPHLEYHIIGDGPLRAKLQDLILDLNLREKAILHGWKNNDAIPDILNRGNLFLLPSVTAKSGDVETQGVVLLEAQASGLPVIATNHNGFPESLVDGESGFLVPERNVEAIAEKITYFIRNPKSLDSMGKKGRRFVEEKFDNQKLSIKLVEMYKSLLGGQYPRSESGRIPSAMDSIS